MGEELLQESLFIGLVKYGEHADIIVWSRSILKVLDVLTYDRSVCDKETTAIYDIGNH